MTAPRTVDPESGRFVCTWDSPMPKDAGGRWAHPEAVLEHDGEYYDYYHCKTCGTHFRVELPE